MHEKYIMDAGCLANFIRCIGYCLVILHWYKEDHLHSPNFSLPVSTEQLE